MCTPQLPHTDPTTQHASHGQAQDAQGHLFLDMVSKGPHCFSACHCPTSYRQGWLGAAPPTLHVQPADGSALTTPRGTGLATLFRWPEAGPLEEPCLRLGLMAATGLRQRSPAVGAACCTHVPGRLPGRLSSQPTAVPSLPPEEPAWPLCFGGQRLGHWRNRVSAWASWQPQASGSAPQLSGLHAALTFQGVFRADSSQGCLSEATAAVLTLQGDKSIASFDLYVGLNDLRAAGAHTQWFAVSRVILHPAYQMWHPLGGDAALVQLQSRIEFSDAVRPVCLPPPTLQLDGSEVCWATGWGLTSLQGLSSNQLQEAQLPLVPQTLCRILYSYPAILPNMLCAGSLGTLRTVCEGDSGGPLVCEFNRTWVQIGIMSWGCGCNEHVYPGVFARVSYFSSWIRYHVERTPLPSQPAPALCPARGAALGVLVTALAGLGLS
ncbi:Serine protease MPN2 [Heterocephalus glaber]|uniref:Serine protease MPN2 n=1 Tax=Heterocephalus glaber TaxID=10181 RepID=G5C9A3_HETGA|nr:Serine protease MPN2 [Heterocephalus glaber]